MSQRGRGRGAGSQKNPNQGGNQQRQQQSQQPQQRSAQQQQQPQQRSAQQPQQRPPQNVAPQQNPVNFVDADAFGPPLGARPNRKNQGTAQPTQPTLSQTIQKSKPTQAGPSKPKEVAQPKPALPAQPTQAVQSQPAVVPKQDKKRPTDDGASGSRHKYQSDEKTRGEDVRGSIHGRGHEDGEKLLQTRPNHIANKKGSTGRVLKVKANYFALTSAGQWQVFHYHVEFSPELENAAIRNALLVQQRETLGGFLYDRGASIYLIRQLEPKMEFQTRDREGREYLMKLTRVGIISALEIQYLQVLNIIMKKASHSLNLQLVGRDYYDPAAAIPIPEYRLQLWPGYATSIRQHERAIMMNAEIKHKLMRDETILDIMSRSYQNSRQNWQAAFIREILGMVVLTKYNNKTYRITDVNFQLNPLSTFERREGPISYIEYYRTVRNVIIKNQTQPLLVSKPTERNMRAGDNQIINLVPELCYATGYTDDMRKNFRLMQETARHTRVGPAGRIERLLKFNNRLLKTPDSVSCFQDWRLQLSNSLVDVDSRVLPVEKIMLGEKKEVLTDHNASWTNALQGKQSMYLSVALERWVVVASSSLQGNVKQFIDMLINVSLGMRFSVKVPEFVFLNDDRAGTLSQTLANLARNNLQMAFVAVSNNSADRYSAIKKTCCVQNALPSQVVTNRVMDPRNMSKLRSVATKVAIQMNAKLGGMPWLVDCKINNVMFIGYDVCHDTNNKANSYGAVVATMDMRQSTCFFSAVSAHTNGEELSNNLAVNVVKAIKQYVTIHKVLPSRILLYRDGVGEGQTNYVHQHELQHLLRHLKTLYGAEEVKLAFVIVSKRINTKFFVGDNNNATNVPPGTVVDDVVTLPERYDFFIVSQAVTQGTATPTSYNVLYDTFGLPPDKLQIMTYKMCHLYYNWSGTTRVPAVCQYAHKLAFLAGNYLHAAPSAGLERLLYFL